MTRDILPLDSSATDVGEMQMSDIDFSTVRVGELLRRWPETARVFLDYRMNCPACSIASFMTIDEAARGYRVDVNLLKRDLMQIANRDDERRRSSEE
jgi:hybrid cluster-associated redox disulfide protein